MATRVPGDQAFQGREGEDVRGVVALPPQPDQAEPGLQPHAQRNQGHLSQRDLRRRELPHHQERRRRVLEDLVRRQVSAVAV